METWRQSVHIRLRTPQKSLLTWKNLTVAHGVLATHIFMTLLRLINGIRSIYWEPRPVGCGYRDDAWGWEFAKHALASRFFPTVTPFFAHTQAFRRKGQRVGGSNMKQLPNEMVRQMAGILRDASDFPTLLECSLVCHVWNDICRPHTVHTVVVRAQNFYTRLEFLNFTGPHLSKHIVELTLQWDDCILDTPEWIPGCLLRLHGLRALRLKNYRATPPLMVSAPFALGILSLIAAVPLKALYLESWSFLQDASDLLHILSCCSASLEDLFIQKTAYDHGTIVDDGRTVDGGGTVLSAVCLESLRILRLFEWIGSAPLPTTDLLECPNLERLEITRTHAGPWDIPSWIPAGLSELVLQVEPGTWMPGLGTSIRPSRLTIDITNQGYSIATYLEVMEWVEDCIDHHIPFPDLLRYLTVKINTYPRSLGPHHSPELEDYVAMSAALQQIHERLSLERITVNIVYTTDEGDTRVDGALELTKLDVAFSQLVDTGLFHVTFEWSDGQERTLLHHVFHNLGVDMPP